MDMSLRNATHGPAQERARTSAKRRPRFEGSNICTWIGFKHVMYVVEEGILEHFRESGLVPRELYERNGLCLEIVDSDARILHALHMDDLVDIDVLPLTEAGEKELRYQVTLWVSRGEERLKAVVAKVVVIFKRDDSPVTSAHAPTALERVAPFTVSRISRGGQTRQLPELHGRGQVDEEDALLRLLKPAGVNGIVWRWHIPYFYCHFTERMQHSGYLRLLEEAEDLFLAQRGISIRKMLHGKKWIPVVPQARVEILQEAYMEEEIYTVYTVEAVYKEYTYTHRMDCFVVRDGALIQTATGRITHGYAVIENRTDWSLVTLDDATLRAVGGARP